MLIYLAKGTEYLQNPTQDIQEYLSKIDVST
jgi:hypothetical protein